MQWVAPGHDGATNTLLATVATGGTQGLFVSSDLRPWHMVAGGAYRFSMGSNGQETVALSDDNPGSGYASRSGRTLTSIALPIPAMRVVGQLT